MKRILILGLAFILLLTSFSGCKRTPADSTQATQSAGDTTPIPPVNPNGLSLEENGIVYDSLAQKAVVKTALAYWARDYRAQYDDTRLNVKNAPKAEKVLYRWQSGVRQNPEDYTSQYMGYLNCAAFVHDVYFAALNIDIGADYTGNLAAIDDARRVYQYVPTGNETNEEKAAVEQTFYSKLQRGDIIVSYSGGGGHTIVYVGTDVMKAAEGITDDDNYIYDSIHSSGTSYVYESITENYEKNGTVGKTSTSHIFDKSSSRYAFKLKSLTILRPLNTFQGEVPANSLNRMLNLENIVAEKLSSHTAGMTAGPGDEITYTFSITNKNTTPVTLAVQDVVPKNTFFVSSENCDMISGKLTWTVTVPAGETSTVSYVVRVKERVFPGQFIESTAGTVGGVSVNCPGIYIGTTLNEKQQAALLTAIENHANSELRGMALANALYAEVLKVKNLLPDDSTTVLNTIFRAEGDYYYLESAATDYRNAIAPGLFGGRYVPQRAMSEDLARQITRYENCRTRWITPDQLMPGDIIIAAQNATASRQRLYLYTGEKMLDLNSDETFFYMEPQDCLTPILSYHRFAVLRPSLMLDNK